MMSVATLVLSLWLLAGASYTAWHLWVDDGQLDKAARDGGFTTRSLLVFFCVVTVLVWPYPVWRYHLQPLTRRALAALVDDPQLPPRE